MHAHMRACSYVRARMSHIYERPLVLAAFFFLFFCPDVPPHTRLLTAPYMYILVNILVILVSLYIYIIYIYIYIFTYVS